MNSSGRAVTMCCHAANLWLSGASRNSLYTPAHRYPHAVEAQAPFEDQRRTLQLGRMLNFRGVCFDIVGDAEHAVQLYVEALARRNEEGNKAYVARAERHRRWPASSG